MQIKILLAAMLLFATPALLADDVLDIDARIEQGRQLLIQLRDDAASVVRARAPAEQHAALARFHDTRDRGVAHAAYQLAFVNLSGRFGVHRNLVEARRNYELAIAQELPGALLDYGLLLYTGSHFEQDRDRGWDLLYRAAQLGDPAATAYVIDRLRNTGDESDAELADAWFAALGMRDNAFVPGVDGDPGTQAQDYAFGQARIAALHREGTILPRSDADFQEWFGQIDPQHAYIALDAAASTYSVTDDLRSNQDLARSLQEIAVTGKDPTVINNHAWLLATAQRAHLRDGEKAVRLMEELLARIDGQSFMVDTLAAAYAEAGDFAAAVAEQDRAIKMFEEEGLNVADAVSRRDAYARGEAWRE